MKPMIFISPPQSGESSVFSSYTFFIIAVRHLQRMTTHPPFMTFIIYAIEKGYDETFNCTANDLLSIL